MRVGDGRQQPRHVRHPSHLSAHSADSAQATIRLGESRSSSQLSKCTRQAYRRRGPRSLRPDWRWSSTMCLGASTGDRCRCDRLDKFSSRLGSSPTRYRKTFALAAAVLASVASIAGCNNPVASNSPGSSPSATAGSASTSATGTTSYTGVVDAVSPSIVLIQTSEGLGSGVIYDGSGDIVTNAHVVGDATQFMVTTSNGKQFQATLVGSYPPSDVAVIKATNPSGLNPAKWADSSQLQVGQVVLAMGNPLGFQSSVTEGIISGLGRTVSEPGGAVLTNVVQTSAAINPGNSGGGLVNLQDQVVGMPTLAAVDPQVGSAAPGIGFALSSNTVQDYANQIIKNGKVVDTRRAYLGVQVGDVQNPSGVVVLAVLPNGPAAQGGVQTGDVITAVNGKPVTNSAALAEVLANLSPGSEASLTVTRNGQNMSLKVILGTLPAG